MNNETTLELVGKAGQFIAAVLQTLGVYAQSDVLRYFLPFFNSFGALIYLAAILVALFSIAIYGNYRKAGYLLVGPGLFAWMLWHTIPSNGIDYQFGARLDSQSRAKQKELIEAALPEIDLSKEAKVSFFYASFDKLVSHVVQKMVAMLIDTELKQDMVDLARERMFHRVIYGRAVDPNFLSLFALFFQGECAEYMQLNHELAMTKYKDPDPTRGTVWATKQTLLKRQAELGSLKTVALRPQSLIDYLAANNLSPAGNSTNITCEELWTAVRSLLKKEAEEDLKPTQEEKDQFDINWEKVVFDVQSKLCSEVYRDPSKCVNQSDLPTIAEHIVRAQMLRNALATTPHSMFMSQASGHATFDQEMTQRHFGNMMARDVNANKTMITHLAGVIPYIQGLILYLLSVAFPFFAIFLLLPGRFSSFVVWMTLWVWVKSWDVGYAMVFLLREVLWDLFPYMGKARIRDNFQSVEWDKSSFSDLLNLVYASDPTINSALYFTIVSSLTLAVPLVTAYLCLGATTLFEAFRLSLDQRPQEMFTDSREASLRLEGTLYQHGVYNERALAARHGGQGVVDNPGKARPKPSGYNLVDSLTRAFGGVSRDEHGDSLWANRIKAKSEQQQFEALWESNAQIAIQGRDNATNRLTQMENASGQQFNALQNDANEGYNTRNPYFSPFSFQTGADGSNIGATQAGPSMKIFSVLPGSGLTPGSGN